MSDLAFIGGGNMARSLIGGLVAQGRDPKSIRVAEPVAALRQALVDDFGVVAETDNARAAAGAALVVLAVKPQVMAQVCRELAPIVVRDRPLVVSIAAGISLANFRAWFGEETAVVRAMPNTPALIGAGITGLHANDRVDAAQRQAAADVLAAVGATAFIDHEVLMDAVTAVSGSGPAYFFLLMESMIEAGMAQGLPEDVAHALVIQTALGASRMAAESGSESPEVLRRRVTSPNGTTQAAIEVFERGGFRALTSAAIARATERGRELSAQAGG